VARLAILAVCCTLASAAATAAPAATAQKACGLILVGKTTYRTVVVQGRVTCTNTRRVLTAFTRTSRNPRGWVCFRGHASQNQRWAVTCATTDGKRVVRSWLVKTIKP
jgi:hypothetical protein